MNLELIERRIECPFCAETISIVVDPSAGSQCYIEDCQVCCQPMQIAFEVCDDEMDNLRVDRAS